MNGDVPTAGTDATVRQGSASVPGRPDLGPCASVSYDGTAPLADVLAALGVPERRPVLVLAGWAGTDLPEETQDALDLLLRAVVVPVRKLSSRVRHVGFMRFVRPPRWVR